MGTMVMRRDCVRVGEAALPRGADSQRCSAVGPWQGQPLRDPNLRAGSLCRATNNPELIGLEGHSKWEPTTATHLGPALLLGSPTPCLQLRCHPLGAAEEDPHVRKGRGTRG